MAVVEPSDFHNLQLGAGGRLDKRQATGKTRRWLSSGTGAGRSEGKFIFQSLPEGSVCCRCHRRPHPQLMDSRSPI